MFKNIFSNIINGFAFFICYYSYFYSAITSFNTVKEEILTQNIGVYYLTNCHCVDCSMIPSYFLGHSYLFDRCDSNFRGDGRKYLIRWFNDFETNTSKLASIISLNLHRGKLSVVIAAHSLRSGLWAPFLLGVLCAKHLHQAMFSSYHHAINKLTSSP